MVERSKNIIFLEYSPNPESGLSFLSLVAGSRITRVRDELEAINWVVLMAASDDRVDLLLIDSIGQEENLERALALFSKYDVSVPVLIIDRFADLGEIESMIARHPCRFPVNICKPENIMGEKWL